MDAEQLNAGFLNIESLEATLLNKESYKKICCVQAAEYASR
jgi:hypothetical protein